MLSENDSAETACNFRISKAWGAYFMHRRLLCSRRHALCRRLKVFMSVILATVMWGLEVFCLTEQQRRRLTVTQITIVSRMMRLPRSLYDTWLEWHIARRRRARAYLQRLHVSFWGHQQVFRYFHFAGHVARMSEDRLCKCSARWRCMIWWRTVQALVTSGGGGHPDRHRRIGVKPNRWEKLLEKFQNALISESATEQLTYRPHPTTWWDVATDRDMWRARVVQFVGSLRW